MQSLKNSSHVNKKFIQSVENSFNESYFSLTESNESVYALLNLTNGTNNFLKMSPFLMRQLNAFEINSKVYLNAISLSDQQSVFSNTTKRKIKLKVPTTSA